jgi:hypothetical protein
MEKEKKAAWEIFYDQGRGFHRTVRGCLKRPQVFTPELVQNIAAMGIEKYFMAVFAHRGLLPRNHTMSDFVEELKTFTALPENLEKSLLYFDSLQFICSMEDIRIVKPKEGDVIRFIEAIDQAALLTERELAHASDNSF